jgi:hypothetical protein
MIFPPETKIPPSDPDEGISQTTKRRVSEDQPACCSAGFFFDKSSPVA